MRLRPLAAEDARWLVNVLTSEIASDELFGIDVWRELRLMDFEVLKAALPLDLVTGVQSFAEGLRELRQRQQRAKLIENVRLGLRIHADTDSGASRRSVPRR